MREALTRVALNPLIALHTRRRVVGAELLDGLPAPVLFVANHASHMDTPLILGALPSAWRRRTAVAAAADYFYRTPLTAHAVALAFNAVPVQRAAGTGADGVVDLHRLIEEGWSLVVYPEGTRSRDGTVGRLHSGAAVLAAHHGLAIVPVAVSGTHAVMPVGRSWTSVARRLGLPRRLAIEVRFGPPVIPRDDEHRTEVMERVRRFFEASGAATTPDPRVRSPRSAAR